MATRAPCRSDCDLGTHSDTGAGTALLIGTAAGLAIAAAATRNRDAPAVTAAPTRVTSASGTEVWGVSAAFGF